MRARLTLAAVSLAVAATACTQSPTAPVAPEAPRFNGGWTIGSGNLHDADTAAVSSHDAAQTTTETCEARGGWTIGSGNFIQPTDPCGGR